jgi:hypothetical protein
MSPMVTAAGPRGKRKLSQSGRDSRESPEPMSAQVRGGMPISAPSECRGRP